MPTEWKCAFVRILPSFWVEVGRGGKEKKVTLEKKRHNSFKLLPDLRLPSPGSSSLPGAWKPQPLDAAGSPCLPSRCGAGSVLDAVDTTPACRRAQHVIWVLICRKWFQNEIFAASGFWQQEAGKGKSWVFGEGARDAVARRCFQLCVAINGSVLQLVTPCWSLANPESY